MKKTLVFQTTFLLSLCYLGFQFLVLPAYLTRQVREKERTESVYNQFRLLYTSLKVPLFLLELDAVLSTLPLQQIHTRLNRRKFLRYGLLKGESATQLEKYRLHFETIGLKLYTTTSLNRERKGSVTSHYFLCGTSLTVHVVVFYNKTEETLWHGDVAWRDELNGACHVNKEHFFNHSGLFDRFGVQKRGDILVPDHPKVLQAAVKDSVYIECNYTRAQQFRVEYPPDNADETQKFQRKARQLIARAKQYLDELGIPFWLSSGTCLGWYRQCDLITYSKDVDFGILIKDYKPELMAAFERGGFFLKHVFGKVSDSYELSFQAGDIKLDLFFFYEEEDYMWNGGTHHETGQKYKYIFPKFAMCWTLFLELKVRVPCPPQPYIEANYGKNWMEPVQEWEWNKSPPNVAENGVWPKEEWEEVIQVY